MISRSAGQVIRVVISNFAGKSSECDDAGIWDCMCLRNVRVSVCLSLGSSAPQSVSRSFCRFIPLPTWVFASLPLSLSLVCFIYERACFFQCSTLVCCASLNR